MKQQTKSPSKRYRSWRLPNDVTDQLVLRLSQLPRSVKTDYLNSEVMSKFVSDATDPPQVRRARAIFKWLATEQENEFTNDRLFVTSEEYNLLPRVGYGRFVGWCRALIARVIGDTPDLEVLIGSFSGGASTSRPRTASNPAGKYVGEAHITPGAIPYYDLIKAEIPVWFSEPGDHCVSEIAGNVLFTVPKKADIDRPACKEPDINMFLQKGCGTFIRRRLKRVGIDLNDQTVNKRLAREGSIDGSLSTIDLSSASDSVSTGLVKLLLPPDWFELLSALRSPFTMIDGEKHRNAMFSSMGNGFTFELESLLFYTLARATAYFRGVPGIISVYGDDIIIPTEMAEYLIWVLEFFGFKTNLEKTFLTGSFRESCGGHYDNGVDITPFYIRKPITTVVDVIHVANSLRKWIFQDYNDPGGKMALVCLDSEAEEIWLWLKSLVPDFLWGGRDTSFKYQLVSNDKPSHRLQEKRTEMELDQRGAYLLWLNATWRRTGTIEKGLVTSEASRGTGKLVVKPVNPLAVTADIRTLFFSELSDVPDVGGI